MFKGLFDLAAPAALVQGEQQFSVDGRDVDDVTATSVDGSPAWETKQLPLRDLRGSADHVISDQKRKHMFVVFAEGALPPSFQTASAYVQ